LLWRKKKWCVRTKVCFYTLYFWLASLFLFFCQRKQRNRGVREKERRMRKGWIRKQMKRSDLQSWQCLENRTGPGLWALHQNPVLFWMELVRHFEMWTLDLSEKLYNCQLKRLSLGSYLVRLLNVFFPIGHFLGYTSLLSFLPTEAPSQDQNGGYSGRHL
jgi:hypothetical protein